MKDWKEKKKGKEAKMEEKTEFEVCWRNVYMKMKIKREKRREERNEPIKTKKKRRMKEEVRRRGRQAGGIIAREEEEEKKRKQSQEDKGNGDRGERSRRLAKEGNVGRKED